MKTLTAALIIEKNKLANTLPWIILLRVTLDDATILKYAAYPEDVTYNSEVYTALPMTVESIKENAQGRLEGVRVSVANVNRAISAYLENENLLGNTVTLLIIHAGHLISSTDCWSETFRINRISITEEVAVFDLGYEDLVKLQLPRQRYLRGRCRFVYQDAHCAYPDDEFGLTTKQTFKDPITTGGPFLKLHGWSVANAHECDTCDVSVTAAGYLTHKNKTGSVKEWWDQKRETAYPYKIVSGDFDAETLLVNSTAWTADGLWAMFLAQSVTTAGHWIAIAWAHDVSTSPTRVVALSTTDGTAGTVEHDATTTWYRYARMARAGNTITWYVKAAAADAWTTLHSEVRDDLGSQVNVGFTVCPRAAGAAVTTVQWDYLRINAGGLTTCDYTLDGPNGCRVHHNQTNYGGFPAIPTGRLYGI